MPYPSAISDYNQRRNGIYNAERYLVVFNGSIMMQFQPSANASGNSNSRINYTTVDSGSTDNVIINMTVLITPTTDYIDDLQNSPDSCLITYVRQAPTATLLYIGETAFQWTTSNVVTVLSEWRVHEKRTIISNNVIYKNVSITRQNPRPRIYDLYDDLVVTSAPSSSYSPTPNAVAMTSGGSISSWNWDTISNGTVTKNASSSQNPTFTLVLGIHWLVLTVTDNGGLTHTLAVKVAVVPRNFDSIVENALVTAISYDLNGGASAGIEKYDSAASIVPGSPCLVFDHLDYTNGITEDRIVISGWLAGEVQLDLSGSNEWGQIKTFQDSIKTIRTLAQTIRLSAFPVREKTSPTAWGDLTRSGVYDALWYIVSEHSTLANVSAQDYPSDYVNYRYPSFNTPGGSLPDIIDALAFRASGDMVNYAPTGEMLYVKSLLYETTDANRNSATVYASLTIDDGVNFRVARRAPGLFGLSVVLAGHASYNTTTKKPRVYHSQAPSGFVPSVLLEELDGIIMTADLSTANAKTQAGKFTANHFFAGVDSVTVSADLISGYYPFPRGDAWLKLTLASTDTLDGSSFDGTERFLATQLTSSWDSENYYIINSVILRRETTGGSNYANETNFVPIGTVQTIPTFPIQNGYPDLSDYETGSDYYGDEYDDYRDGWEDPTLPPEEGAEEAIPDKNLSDTVYVPLKGGAVNGSFVTTNGVSYLIRVSNDGIIQEGSGSGITTYDFTASTESWSAVTSADTDYGSTSIPRAGEPAAGTWAGGGWSYVDYRSADNGFYSGVWVQIDLGTPFSLIDTNTLTMTYDLTKGSYGNPLFTAVAIYTKDSGGTWTQRKTLSAVAAVNGTGLTLTYTATGNLEVHGLAAYCMRSINPSGPHAGNAVITEFEVNLGASDTLRGDAFYYGYNIGSASAYSGQAGLNLNGSGISHGQAYDSSHVYEFSVTGTGSVFTWSYTDEDGDYSDNQNRFLKVELFSP